jgi:hypothetical protein
VDTPYKKTARVAGRFLLQWVERWLSELSAWLGTGLVLWPWLVADGMFVLFLGVSTQGQAQADSLFKRPEQTGWLFGSLAISILLTLTACLFTSLVAAYRRRAVETVSRAGNAGGESGFAWGGAARRYLAWSFVLAATPGLALAWASEKPSVAVFVLVLCAASAWAVFWLLEHRGSPAAGWLDRLDELYRMRVLLATAVTALAAGSLWLGATLSIRDPDELHRIGAPAIELVGLSAVASLFGVVFAAWPRCWRWPRLGRLLAGALVVYNLSGQPLSDPQNPLLREERLLAHADIRQKEADKQCHHASDDLGLDLRALEAGDAPAVVQDFVVGAEGGGIRATYWTAIGLGLTDMAVADDFGAKLR